MKKKLLTLLLVSAMLVSSFASCGKTEPSPVESGSDQTPAVSDEVKETPESESETEKATESETEAPMESATETEPATEAATETEPATEAATETEPATEAATETEPATEAATETEPATEAATETEPATEAATETEPATEAATETEPTASETSEGDLVKYKDLYIPTYNYQNTVTKGKNGDSYWNLAKPKQLQSRWYHVFVHYREDNGNVIDGNAWLLPGVVEKYMNNLQYSISESKAIGTDIILMLNTIQFNPTFFKKYGVDPTPFYQLNSNGGYFKSDYKAENWYACFFRDEWVDLNTSANEEFAKAGLGGVLYDLSVFGSTVGASYFCHCPTCEREWEEYSTEVFGTAQKMPSRQLIYNKTVNREFAKFKWKQYAELLVKYEEAGKQYNPNYKVYPNHAVTTPEYIYEVLCGMTNVTTEYNRFTAGEDSTMYMFRLHEAATAEPLMGMFNDTAQITPIYRYETALAEAYAGGGEVMMSTVNSDAQPINQTYSAFVLENEELLSTTWSCAETAILFSYQDQYFVHMTNDSMKLVYENDTCRKAAATLAKMGVPYDFVIREKEGFSLETLKQYQALILPDLKLVDNELEQILKQYVEEGGNLIVLGAFAQQTIAENGLDFVKRKEDLLKTWTGSGMGLMSEATLGNGKIFRQPLPSGSTEKAAVITDQYRQMAEDAGLFDQVRVNLGNLKSNVETTIKKNSDDSILAVHMVNYNFGAGRKLASYGVSVKVPEGKTVKSVSVISPGQNLEKIGLTWEVKDGRVEASGQFGRYSILVMELN